MSAFMNVATSKKAYWLFCLKLKPLVKLYEMWIYLMYNLFIPARCEIDEEMKFGHKDTSVSMHKLARADKNCMIA